MARLRKFLGLALLAAAAAAPAQEKPRKPFEVRYLAPFGRRIDTQFYDYTGDGTMDALVVSIDFDADPPTRWLALHAGTKAGLPEKPDQIWSVAPTTCALATANVVPEGGVDILEIAPDGISYHAFEKGMMTEEPRKLLHTRTFFTTPSNRTLPMWMSPVDLNNDKLDDLIVPVPDGYKIYFQTAPGLFGIVQKLESDLAAPKTPALAPQRFAADWERLLGRGLPSTSGFFNLHEEMPRVTPVDLNGDGLKDLASLVGSRLTVFFQSAPQKFGSGPKDRVQSQLATLDPEKKDDVVSVSDVQFVDINADGNMDLVVAKIEGELKLTESIGTRIYYHLGTGKGKFMPDGCISIKGISLNPTFIDMNGDGKLDVLTSRLRTDLIKHGVDRLLGDVTVTYEVFQFEKSSYSVVPVFDFDIHIPIEDIQKRSGASRPMFQVPGDLSGDGRPDAVIYNPQTTKLEVRKGKQSWAASDRPVIDFEKDVAATYDIDKDNPPKWISYMDMDGDGRQDILLNYAGQLIILLSRF